MRRCQSAPANLCQMAHKTKCRCDKNVKSSNVIIPIVDTKKQNHFPYIEQKKCEEGVLSEIVTTLSEEATVTDPTAQMVFTMVARYLLRLDDIDFETMLRDAFLRIFISFVSHKMMVLFLHALPDAIKIQ